MGGPFGWGGRGGVVGGGWQWVGSDILGPPPTRVCERGCWVTVEGRERFFLTPLLEVSVLSPVRCWCNLVVSRKKTGGRWHLPACRACLPSLSPLLWTSPNGSSVFIVREAPIMRRQCTSVLLPRLKGLVSRKKTGGRRHLPACQACLPSLSPLLWTSPNGSSVFIVREAPIMRRQCTSVLLPRLKGLVSRKKTGGRRHLPACQACLPSLSPLLWTSPNGSSVFDIFRLTGNLTSSCSHTIEVKGRCWL